VDDNERERMYARYPELRELEERIIRVAKSLAPDDEWLMLMELKRIVDEHLMMRDN